MSTSRCRTKKSSVLDIRMWWWCCCYVFMSCILLLTNRNHFICSYQLQPPITHSSIHTQKTFRSKKTIMYSYRHDNNNQQQQQHQRHDNLFLSATKNQSELLNTKRNHPNNSHLVTSFCRKVLLSSCTILASSIFLISTPSYAASTTPPIGTYTTSSSTLIITKESSSASTSTTTLAADDKTMNYDGFANYAKENQMEQSDVSCFMNQCGVETKELFRNPRGIKGIVCLGQCKGEQACATQCFAQYGSESLNNWLSCTIEENQCVKVPQAQSIDNSAENIGYTTTIKKFDPKSLVGTWYKTNGLNRNYDGFDCQTNTFEITTDTTKNNPVELDMGIFFRVQRPMESGGGYWENSLTEHMIVDSSVVGSTSSSTTTANKNIDGNDMNPSGRTMHTSGKMYGLQFEENWYILGESDGSGSIPPFKLVAYKGHTLQGNYEGAFVYAKEPTLPISAIVAVQDAAEKAGLNYEKDFFQIDNTCPTGNSLNDELAGTGTSTTDWINLITGEGGVIDWISPGWRGEYKK